jgi:hypothetical protein
MATIEVDGKQMDSDSVAAHGFLAGRPICTHAVGDGGCNLPKETASLQRERDGSCKADNCGACQMGCDHFVLKQGLVKIVG